MCVFMCRASAVEVNTWIFFFLRDVNRGEVVEVFDISFSPPDRQLRSSVFLVVLSRVCRHVSSLVVLRLRLSNGLLAIDCVRALFFVNEFFTITWRCQRIKSIWLNAANAVVIRSIVF